MRRIGLVALVAAATLVFAGSAQARKGTFAGYVGGTGKFALDAKISKRGFIKKVTALRGTEVPSTCEISGPGILVNFDTPVVLRVSQVTAKFAGKLTQPTYGNVSTISGKFKHKRVKGTLEVDYHYPAEGPFPEENCDTGPLRFNAKLGNPDQTGTPPPAVRLGR